MHDHVFPDDESNAEFLKQYPYLSQHLEHMRSLPERNSRLMAINTLSFTNVAPVMGFR